MGAQSLLPGPVKRLVRDRVKLARRAFVRTLFSFDKHDFRKALVRVGVRPGAVLMVHSSYDRFEGFRGSPSDVIEALQDAVSPGGTIMMPNMPFTGSTREWLNSGQVFDVRRTPSRVGLLTELFRRSAGVVRTVHPTHPVAIWGALAADLSRDAHTSTTPCGRPSPFARLVDVGGQSLLLGTGIEYMTFFHAVEEFLEPDMPFSPFTAEIFELHSKDAGGNLMRSRLRLLEPHYSSRRRVGILTPELRRTGDWHKTTVGRLSVLLLAADAVLEACRFLAKQGIFCYDL
jgi:aminoglycoside 3-N-acetyltransferase